jgi:hypothetical protein
VVLGFKREWYPNGTIALFTQFVQQYYGGVFLYFGSNWTTAGVTMPNPVRVQ